MRTGTRTILATAAVGIALAMSSPAMAADGDHEGHGHHRRTRAGTSEAAAVATAAVAVAAGPGQHGGGGESGGTVSDSSSDYVPTGGVDAGMGGAADGPETELALLGGGLALGSVLVMRRSERKLSLPFPSGREAMEMRVSVISSAR